MHNEARMNSFSIISLLFLIISIVACGEHNAVNSRSEKVKTSQEGFDLESDQKTCHVTHATIPDFSATWGGNDCDSEFQTETDYAYTSPRKVHCRIKADEKILASVEVDHYVECRKSWFNVSSSAEPFVAPSRSTEFTAFRVGGKDWGHSFGSGNLSDKEIREGSDGTVFSLHIDYHAEFPRDREYFVSKYSAYLVCAQWDFGDNSDSVARFFHKISPAKFQIDNNKLLANFYVHRDAITRSQCKIEISHDDTPDELAFTQVRTTRFIDRNIPNGGPYPLKELNDAPMVSFPPEAENDVSINNVDSLLEAVRLSKIYLSRKDQACNENRLQGADIEGKIETLPAHKCPDTVYYQVIRMEETLEGEQLICDYGSNNATRCFNGENPSLAGLTRIKPVSYSEKPFNGSTLEGFLHETATIELAREFQHQPYEFVDENNLKYLVNTCKPDLIQAVAQDTSEVPIKCAINEAYIRNILQPHKTYSDAVKKQIRRQEITSIIVPLAIGAAVLLAPSMLAIAFKTVGLTSLASSATAVQSAFVNTLTYAGLAFTPTSVEMFISSINERSKCSNNDFRCKFTHDAAFWLGVAELGVFLPMDAFTLTKTAHLARSRTILSKSFPNSNDNNLGEIFVLSHTDEVISSLIKNTEETPILYKSLIRNLARKIKATDPEITTKRLNNFLSKTGKRADELEFADFQQLVNKWDEWDSIPNNCMGLTSGLGLLTDGPTTLKPYLDIDLKDPNSWDVSTIDFRTFMDNPNLQSIIDKYLDAEEAKLIFVVNKYSIPHPHASLYVDLGDETVRPIRAHDMGGDARNRFKMFYQMSPPSGVMYSSVSFKVSRRQALNAMYNLHFDQPTFFDPVYGPNCTSYALKALEAADVFPERINHEVMNNAPRRSGGYKAKKFIKVLRKAQQDMLGNSCS